MQGTKAKISISVPAQLVEAMDLGVEQRRYRSRSAVVEALLTEWARKVRDSEIEAYYAGFSAEERAEDAEWATLGMEAFRASAMKERLAVPRSTPTKRRARRPRR